MIARFASNPIISLGLGLLLNACGSSDGLTTPLRARIITSTENGYAFRDVSFQTLQNLRKMEGELAVLRGDAALNLNSEIGEVVKSSNPDALYSSIGQSVNLDYTVEEGVAIPRNFQSMAMLAIYYDYERVFLFWRDNLGLDLQDFGKLRLFMNPRIEANQDNTTVTGVIKVNAAFLPGPRDFWFFKTSPLEAIPINMNFGVLAHEFGHAIFDLAFAKKDAGFYEVGGESGLNSADLAELEFKLSALNEGLSDFFSWMVTGKLSEFGESLAILGKERVMPVAWTLSQLEETSNTKIVCNGGFYCYGSVFASALYEIASIEGASPVAVGKAVFAALSDLREDWTAAKSGVEFGYHTIINRIYPHLDPTIASKSCTLLRKWFDANSVKEKIECTE